MWPHVFVPPRIGLKTSAKSKSSIRTRKTEIGRGSCRGRGENSGVGGSLKKKKKVLKVRRRCFHRFVKQCIRLARVEEMRTLEFDLRLHQRVVRQWRVRYDAALSSRVHISDK